jgi:hypothetical protein
MPENCGINGLPNVDKGNFDGILSKDEEHAAGIRKRRAGSRRGACEWWGAVTSSTPRHLRQASEMLQHTDCMNDFAQNEPKS